MDWSRLKRAAERALGEALGELELIGKDAGSRRYARASIAAGPGPASVILLHTAGVDPTTMKRFWEIARLVSPHGIRVPRELATVPDEHLTVMTDLGRETLHARIGRAPDDMAAVSRTLRLLRDWGCVRATATIDPYDVDAQWRDLGSTFIPAAQSCGWSPAPRLLDRLEAVKERVVATSPRGLVHSDFHARNVVIAADGTVGVVDLQDAASGPIAVDWAAIVYDHNRRATDADSARWERAARDVLRGNPALEPVTSALMWGGLFWHLRLAGVCSRLLLHQRRVQFTRELLSVSRWLIVLSRSPYAEPITGLVRNVADGAQLLARSTPLAYE